MHALAAQYTPARPRPSLYFQINPITAQPNHVCTVYIKENQFQEFRKKKQNHFFPCFSYGLDCWCHDPERMHYRNGIK